MQIHVTEAAAEEVSGLLRALAHPARLLLLCQMTEGRPTVGELARRIGRAEPAVSQQLARLRLEGLVRAERDGQAVRYAIARPEVLRLLSFLCENFCPDPEARP